MQIKSREELRLQKNELYDIHIDDLTVDGNGVGRINGLAVFVGGMLPGEEGRVRLIKLAKNYAVGRLEELTLLSPDRVEPPCPVFSRCGGCSLMHMSYPAQLAFKQKRVTDCIRRIAGSSAPINDIVPAEAPLRYRNKTAFPVRQGRDGVSIGCFARRTHRVVDVDDCLISSEKCADILTKLRGYIQKYGVSAYDEQTQTGVLRHVVIRESSLGERILTLVINADGLKHEDALIELFKDDVAAIALNKNTSHGNTILTPHTRVIYGSGNITEEICSLKFEISVNSFLQVNHAQTEKLYSLALERAQICADDVVADLYCGAGTISLIAARRAKAVYGIEIVPQAIENAKRNALLNGIDNAHFLNADCAEGFEKIARLAGRPDVIIVDPPRKGLDEKVINDVAAVGTSRLVYVSCDPATLARDAALFAELGYELKEVTPVDMFPNTTAVENVAVLIKE